MLFCLVLLSHCLDFFIYLFKKQHNWWNMNQIVHLFHWLHWTDAAFTWLKIEMCLYTTLHHHKQNPHRQSCNHRHNHNTIKNNRPKYSIHIYSIMHKSRTHIRSSKSSSSSYLVDKTLFAEFHQEFNPFLNDLKNNYPKFQSLTALTRYL